MARLFLGIESSCDDTAAAVISDDRRILSSIVADQASLHAAFGGIVPEIAARAHAEKLDVAVEAALNEACIGASDIDTVAVTAGPGLIGGVLSGVMCAKGIATGLGRPLLGVNHLAGHALTPRLTDNVAFPYLLLLVSGGHCQLLIVSGPNGFQRLGGTLDDSPGEAFDKTARALGLPGSGGPAVEDEAASGDPERFRFPRPLLGRPDCNMSFSGLKTALVRERDALVSGSGGLSAQDRADLCASFQAAVTEILAVKTARAIESYLSLNPRTPVIAVAGGVAANAEIRRGLDTVATRNDLEFVAPPAALCTDNAAMIAWAGIELDRIANPGLVPLVARPRWPLDTSQPALLGSGTKGAKA